MTKEHIERLIEAHTELYDLIYMTACDWCEITHVGSKPDYYLEGCTVDFVNSDTVTLEWEGYSHCGERNYFRAHFPLAYLWSDDWYEEEKQRSLEATIKAVAKRQAEQAAQKRRDDLAEYEQLLKLQKKFADVDPNAIGRG